MGIAQEKVQERFDEIRSYLDYVITNEGIISAFGEDFTYEEAKNAEMSAYMDEAKKAIKEELARQQAAEQMSEWAFINPARYNVVDCASSLVGKARICGAEKRGNLAMTRPGGATEQTVSVTVLTVPDSYSGVTGRQVFRKRYGRSSARQSRF